MAFVAGVTEQQLEEAGRADAAVRLAELRAVSDRGTGGPTAFEDLELIFSSSLSAERKLTVIRMVLQLHAEIEGQLPPGGGQDVQP
jgi:hypothetical protein